jgi:putative hydrolase of the HAD superfamily
MSTPPRFIYFDLGNVLLNFDEDKAARQIADVAGIPVERVKEVVFDGLAGPFERGEMDSRQFYEILCEQIGKRPDYRALKLAASNMFTLNVRIIPIISALQRVGHRLGILSNTNEMHWQYVCERYTIFSVVFQRFALSFEIGAMKPEREIYTAAAEIADVAPEEIFFTDDRPDLVAGAREAGFDAVTFVGPAALSDELRSRGVRFNY